MHAGETYILAGHLACEYLWVRDTDRPCNYVRVEPKVEIRWPAGLDFSVYGHQDHVIGV
jgi:hypothetical protein